MSVATTIEPDMPASGWQDQQKIPAVVVFVADTPRLDNKFTGAIILLAARADRRWLNDVVVRDHVAAVHIDAECAGTRAWLARDRRFPAM